MGPTTCSLIQTLTTCLTFIIQTVPFLIYIVRLYSTYSLSNQCRSSSQSRESVQSAETTNVWQLWQRWPWNLCGHSEKPRARFTKCKRHWHISLKKHVLPFPMPLLLFLFLNRRLFPRVYFALISQRPEIEVRVPWLSNDSIGCRGFKEELWGFLSHCSRTPPLCGCETWHSRHVLYSGIFTIIGSFAVLLLNLH